MNFPLSKSQVRAMGCEVHFASRFVTHQTSDIWNAGPGADLGNAFHKYRQDYIGFLRWNGKSEDKQWATDWLGRASVTDEARDLIARDIERFQLDLAPIVLCEHDFMVDDTFSPTENKDIALVRGLVDLCYVYPDSNFACIRDAKTGHGAAVDETEGMIYAALLFAHYPTLETVTMVWDFVRSGVEQAVEYTAAALGDYKARIAGMLEERDRIAETAQTQKWRLKTNPHAGLCWGCEARCPLLRKEIGHPPLLSIEAAKDRAAQLRATETWVAKAREDLREWVRANGPLDLGGEVCGLRVSSTSELPLLSVLREVAGINLDSFPGAELFKVDLGKLTVGGLKDQAKATKKRPGLAELLERIQVTGSTREELRFEKPPAAQEEDLSEKLVLSIDEAKKRKSKKQKGVEE